GRDGEGDLPGILRAEGEAGVERSDRDERRDPVEPRGLDQLMIRRRLGHMGVDVHDRPRRLPRRGCREPRGPRFLERLCVHRCSFLRFWSYTIYPHLVVTATPISPLPAGPPSINNDISVTSPRTLPRGRALP